MSNHELVELANEKGSNPCYPYSGNWMCRCSCGWNAYFGNSALDLARAWIRHRDRDADDRYTWGDMEQEWADGYSEGYEMGSSDGEAEGRVLGREELIEQLNKLKEAEDVSGSTPVDPE